MVEIIVMHPCLEVLLCETMNLSGCTSGTCDDIIYAIERATNKEYEKKLLPTLVVKELQKRMSGMAKAGGTPMQVLPSQLKDFINVINTCCSKRF